LFAASDINGLHLMSRCYQR